MNNILIICTMMSFFVSSAQNNEEVYRANYSEPYAIAYNVNAKIGDKENYEVLVMNMDGTNKQNITNHPDVAWTYYAYKDRLFFISDRDTCYRCYFLYETDSEGNQVKKVSDLQLEDSWMSSRFDGQELIVTGRKGNDLRFQLFIINTENGAYRQITQDTAARYGDPCFSPDGSEIVFSYKKDKRNKSTHEELFLMKLDGSQMRQLTHYPENNPSAKDYGYRAGAAKWHPTENFISYVSLQDGRHSIYAVSSDGSKSWKLLDNQASEGWHDWSPDGNWLVFNSSDNAESQFHINLMNWETKQEKVLTDQKYTAQQAPVFVKRK